MNSIVVLRVILYLFRNEDLINKNMLHFLHKIHFYMFLKFVFLCYRNMCVWNLMPDGSPVFACHHLYTFIVNSRTDLLKFFMAEGLNNEY